MHGVDLHVSVGEWISKQEGHRLQGALAKGVQVWKAFWQVR